LTFVPGGLAFMIEHKSFSPATAAAMPSYSTMESAPGLKFFRCERLSATMSTKGCSSRWREGQVIQGEAAARFEVCRSCPLGASHAGKTHVPHSRFFGAEICPRCRKGATRIIGGTRCILCYNREREMRIGRNARGNAPKALLKTKPLLQFDYLIEIDGAARHAVSDPAIDLFESVFQTMRTTRGSLAFAFHGPTA
jgi:hypothetical protein